MSREERTDVEHLLIALGYAYDRGSGHEAPAWRHAKAPPILAEWIGRPNLIAGDLDLARFIFTQGHQEGVRVAQKAMRAAMGCAYGFPRE